MKGRAPKARVCYICGRPTLLPGFENHVIQCRTLFEKREAQKPPKERRPCPTDPMLAYGGGGGGGGYSSSGKLCTSSEEYLYEANKASQKAWEATLSTCDHCGRSFLPDKLIIHQRSCTAQNPARRVDASLHRTQGNSYDESHAGSIPSNTTLSRLPGGYGNSGNSGNGSGRGGVDPMNDFPTYGHLLKCSHCGRNFNEVSYTKHVKICQKVFQRKRKVFDSSKARIKGTELAAYVNNTNSSSSSYKGLNTMRRSTTSQGRSHTSHSGGSGSGGSGKWKAQSVDFRRAIRLAKQVSLAEKKSKMTGIPLHVILDQDVTYNRYVEKANTMSSSSTAVGSSLGYRRCPTCGRSFNEKAAERHIPKCKDIINKPTMLMRGSGTPSYSMNHNSPSSIQPLARSSGHRLGGQIGGAAGGGAGGRGGFNLLDDEDRVGFMGSDYNRTTTTAIAPSRKTSATSAAIPSYGDYASTTKCGKKHSAWVPFAVVDDLQRDYPTEIEVLGEKFAIWYSDSDKGQWSIVANLCPHRLAPLSEGRIDKSNGCLECPYHGWQFNTQGQCVHIPQAEEKQLKLLQQRGSDQGSERGSGSGGRWVESTAVRSLPVHIVGGILWGYLPIAGLTASIDKLPEEILPILTDPARDAVSREVPCSFDFVIENFMDPAHIPFAHHKLQGVRKDGSPIPMQVTTDLEVNSTHVEVTFQDVIRGQRRDGYISFQPPFYYHFRTMTPPQQQQQQQQEGEEKVAAATTTTATRTPLALFVVPVAPGRSRVIISQLTLPWIRKLPKFLIHYMGMRFVDSDLWIHDQERAVRSLSNAFDEVEEDSVVSENNPMLGAVMPGSPKYALVTDSDKGTIAWRRWWRNYMAHMPAFGSQVHRLPITAPSKMEQRDWYDYHGKHCKHCQQAMLRAESIQQFYGPLLSLTLFALSSRWEEKVFSVLLYAILQMTSSAVLRMTKGPNAVERISMAQAKD
eukprot:gene9375-10353_t